MTHLDSDQQSPLDISHQLESPIITESSLTPLGDLPDDAFVMTERVSLLKQKEIPLDNQKRQLAREALIVLGLTKISVAQPSEHPDYPKAILVVGKVKMSKGDSGDNSYGVTLNTTHTNGESDTGLMKQSMTVRENIDIRNLAPIDVQNLWLVATLDGETKLLGTPQFLAENLGNAWQDTVEQAGFDAVAGVRVDETDFFVRAGKESDQWMKSKLSAG